MKFILGKKLGMSQLFSEGGEVVPVTLVEAGPCKVLQIKTKEKDGYEAIQVGFEQLKEKKVKKSLKDKPYRYIKEFRSEAGEAKVGDDINTADFQEGQEVKVIGISKGKGFQGAVKRWGFSGRGASHGVKHEQRTLGSVGTSFPERVIKGRKMPGRMGSDQVTVKNLKIIKIDAQNNLIAIKGALPGRRGTLLEIRG